MVQCCVVVDHLLVVLWNYSTNVYPDFSLGEILNLHQLMHRIDVWLACSLHETRLVPDVRMNEKRLGKHRVLNWMALDRRSEWFWGVYIPKIYAVPVVYTVQWIWLSLHRVIWLLACVLTDSIDDSQFGELLQNCFSMNGFDSAHF